MNLVNRSKYDKHDHHVFLISRVHDKMFTIKPHIYLKNCKIFHVVISI